jgi:Ca2+/Na+ antiporter
VLVLVLVLALVPLQRLVLVSVLMSVLFLVVLALVFVVVLVVMLDDEAEDEDEVALAEFEDSDEMIRLLPPLPQVGLAADLTRTSAQLSPVRPPKQAPPPSRFSAIDLAARIFVPLNNNGEDGNDGAEEGIFRRRLCVTSLRGPSALAAAPPLALRAALLKIEKTGVGAS